jgi:hypothetical protein
MVVAAVLAWALVVAVTLGLFVRARRARRHRRALRTRDRELPGAEGRELPAAEEGQGLPERASNPGS